MSRFLRRPADRGSSTGAVPRWLAVLMVPLTALVVLTGLWVTGGVLTDEAVPAMLLAGAWLVAAGAVAVLAGLRWRWAALPVLATYVVTSLGAGGYLLLSSRLDRVVDERVLVAERSRPPSDGQGGAPVAPATGPVRVSGGTFRDGEHATDGVATLLRTPDGRRVLTLTAFRTSPGPDLRVYVVPGDGSSVAGARDLGRLKGNRGDQQYAVPPGTVAGAVVIWCRAFSVAFGVAGLR